MIIVNSRSLVLASFSQLMRIHYIRSVMLYKLMPITEARIVDVLIRIIEFFRWSIDYPCQYPILIMIPFASTPGCHGLTVMT